jgi:transcriptional regulator with XRE-family HTH domain
MGRKITIYDIADELKISPSTVSRALAGNTLVNIQTRKKIIEYCEIDGLNGIAIDYHRFVDVVLPTTLWPRYGIQQDREYPEWDYGYHPEMISIFNERYGYDPRELEDPSIDENWLQFRCDQITEVANEIADLVHSYGKVMAASPFPTPF